MMEKMWNEEESRWVDIFPEGDPLGEQAISSYMPLWAMAQRDDAYLLSAP